MNVKPLTNFKLVTFESRKSQAMRQLIQKQGGTCIEAPSMQEIPLEINDEIRIFMAALFDGEIDIMIYMTGVGAKTLIELVGKERGYEETIRNLSLPVTVIRGPKPQQILKEHGIPIALKVSEPNTWREVISEIDDYEEIGSVSGKTIAIQEYGVSNNELIQNLISRGAKVLRVPIYKWSLPDDTEPLRQGIEVIIQQKADAVLFTSGNQINNVFFLAEKEGLLAELKLGLSKTVIASIGPVCTETLQHSGVRVDIEPEHSTIGAFVLEIANHLKEKLEVKENLSVKFPKPELCQPNEAIDKKALANSILMKALRREKTDRIPIWLMRQAGRYMKEYKEIRKKVPFLEFCKNKELVTQITVLAQEKLGADAAIIFSDILVLIECFGMDLEYSRNEGPAIQVTLDDGKSIDNLKAANVREQLAYVYDGIRLTRQSLQKDIPLIGFAGAPFTLASYMLEGGSSKNFARTKTFMYQDKVRWNVLLSKIADALIEHLKGQIDAGVQAVQLFDSWVGCLSPQDYIEYAMPYSKKVLDAIKGQVPTVHFGTSNTAFLNKMAEAGGDCIGVDFRVGLGAAWRQIGYDRAIQGNLDPLVLYADQAMIKSRAKDVIDEAGGRPGFIFNLGHGILPETPFDNAKYLIDIVHEMS